MTFVFFFFFNDTATTEIYTLSLHDALPIFGGGNGNTGCNWRDYAADAAEDRKSTRLNSSHHRISYAVFCLKKKKQKGTVGVSATLGSEPGGNRERGEDG